MLGVIMALHQRTARGGEGRFIDAALQESVCNVIESQLPQDDALGAVRQRAGSALPGIAPTHAERCSDGQPGAVSTALVPDLRTTREQPSAQLSKVIAVVRQADVPVHVSLSCVFGCRVQGDVPQEGVPGWIECFEARGVQGISLRDTTGMAYPAQL